LTPKGAKLFDLGGVIHNSPSEDCLSLGIAVMEVDVFPLCSPGYPVLVLDLEKSNGISHAFDFSMWDCDVLRTTQSSNTSRLPSIY